MGTLIHCCANDGSTTPPEGSSAAPEIPGVPITAFNPHMPLVCFVAQEVSWLFTQSH